MKITLAKHMTACLLAACMAAQPVFAAVTGISNEPLGAAAGTGSLPNLLFILDDSGSMARDYNPDYVNDNNTCMTTSGNNTNCQRGDPPFEAGGERGFNGVGYDPNFTYPPGLTSSGQPIINPPSGTLTPTALTPDAYLGGANVNVTTNFTDRRFCNANNVCKRNGADNAGAVLPAGQFDAAGNPLAAGQFPYRTNASSASTIVTFGLPEMMPIGSFSRAGNTVTVDTIEPHGLTTADRIFVTGVGVPSMDLAFVAVASSVTANRFTYTSTGSGTITVRPGSYRRYGPGSFARSGNTVTVTVSTGHFVVTGDIVSIAVPTQTAMNVTGATITVTSATTFTYTTGPSGTIASTPGFGVRTGLYNQASNVNGPPVAYGITPIEYCANAALTDCIQVIPPATPPASHPFPAYVRFCRSQAEALAPGAVTAIATTPPTPRCQLKYVNVTGLTGYTFTRYGRFNRDTIASTVATYLNRPNRSDCASAPSCSYTEEIQNYAKWYTYYRDRMLMMKTSAGRSFLPFISNPTATPPKPDRLRVGFITINPSIPNVPAISLGGSGPGTNVEPAKYLKIDNFNTTQASNWYNKFYSIFPGPATPLRVALSRAGWIFAGKLNTGLTNGIPAADDPVQASCQKNYAFLTTDGFWNQGVGQDLAGVAIGNQDNVNNSTASPYAAPDFFVSRASGTYDGGVLSGTTAGSSPGGSGTLADVALYYYKTDLRGASSGPTGPATSPSTTPPGGNVALNNVSAKPGSVDFARHQHMNTYTIGLADGLMRYQPDYATAATGDFANIKNALPAAGNCFWSTGTCNWPAPQADNQSALDDLWHAAVNGRGAYFSAVNPNALATGLSSALNSLDIAVASAAAAATSSPQVSQENTKAFSTTYQTSNWAGEVYAQLINPKTGVVETSGPNNGKLWEAHKLLLTRLTPRVLKTFDVVDPTNPKKLKNFLWGSLSAVEQDYFKNYCNPIVRPAENWSQCSTRSPAQKITANNGSSLVDFLSGNATHEGTVFRDRATQDPVTGAQVQTILGDIINSQPVAVSAPLFKYENAVAPQGDYKTFRETPRAGFLLVGANDGFLHAFDQNSGEELWAYAPRFLLPSMYQLADQGYPGQHRFFVDGTPEVADVFDTAAATWKTIVVGGMNSGGRGFYALDVTNPADPKGLWEFCSTSTPADVCLNDPAVSSRTDPDLGFSYGNPVIGRRAFDGRWVVVVTSGLNNVPPPSPGVGSGDGRGHFYVLDAITGQILNKISTGAGDTTTPSGLMKIGAYYPDGLNDPTFTHVYGGDQQGNVWRLNLSKQPSTIATTIPAYPSFIIPVADGGTPPFVRRLAKLKDASGRVQPITARPAGTHVGNIHIYYVGTGRYLGTPDLADQGPGQFAWQQTIYGIKDQLSNDDPAFSENTGFTPPASFRDGTAPLKAVQQTLTQSGANRTISKNTVDWATQDGFFIDLNPGNSPGERVFLDVRLVQGTLIVTSNIPAAGGGCVPGGQSYQYGLDYKTGGYVGDDAAAFSGQFINEFLVGAAIIQLADGSIKALNKSITGRNLTTDIPIHTSFKGKRFSYRER